MDETLRAVGFARIGRRLTWVRDTGQLLHIVNVWTRWGKYYIIQWGIRHEPVTSILWGEQRDAYDVAYSCITGRPRGEGSTWEVDEETTDESLTRMAQATAASLSELDNWLSGIQTRQDALKWLMLDDDDHRQATVPHSGPLRLFTAVSFAAVDGDSIACSLANDLRASFGGRRHKETRERMERLMAWVTPLCEGAHDHV